MYLHGGRSGIHVVATALEAVRKVHIDPHLLMGKAGHVVLQVHREPSNYREGERRKVERDENVCV